MHYSSSGGAGGPGAEQINRRRAQICTIAWFFICSTVSQAVNDLSTSLSDWYKSKKILFDPVTIIAEEELRNLSQRKARSQHHLRCREANDIWAFVTHRRLSGPLSCAWRRAFPLDGIGPG
jgi:hypothetical protein